METPKVDMFGLVKKLPFKPFGQKLLNTFLTFGIPFNRGLGLQVLEIEETRAKILSPARRRRKNHLGSAHACALAVLGEVPAGLLVTQRYPFNKYRFILGSLSIDYHKQGRGKLYAEATAPDHWTEVVSDDGLWILINTKITNDESELVAEVRTKWQVKSWSQVRKS